MLIVIAFAGTPWFVPVSILHHWLLKTGYEAVATPFTYAIVGYLKRKEGIDIYDRDTNFNPLGFRWNVFTKGWKRLTGASG